jgi:hypothetical protein
MQNKHQAGYFSKNVNKDAINYLRYVLNERNEDPLEDRPLEKSEIIKKINEIDKITE